MPHHAGETARPQGRLRTVVRFTALWALLSVAGCLWALATPVMGSPDEPSHVVKAAAVARGQLLGEGGAAPVDRTTPGTPTLVSVPEAYDLLPAVAACFAFQENVSAECSPALEGDPGRLEQVGTFAGKYPPLYYALVGGPSLVLEDSRAVYGVRAASAVLCALFLAVGVGLLHGAARSRLVLVGVAAALTPMVLFMAGTVNPSGLEVAAAFALWGALLAMVFDPDSARLGLRLAAATAAAAVLVNVRASSPLMALLVLLLVLAVAPVVVLRQVVRHRAAPWVLAAGLLSGAVAVGWVLYADPLTGPVGLFPEYASTEVVLRDTVGRSQRYLREMIGVFGWLDTPSPLATYLLWSAVLSTMVVLALSAVRPRRQRLAVVLFLALIIVLPVALQVPGADDVGLIWQGRYLLPVAVGLPLLLGLALDRSAGGVVATLRLERVAAPALLVAQVGAFYFALRRYAVGERGPVLVLDATWDPPVGLWPLTLAYAVTAGVGLVMAARWSRGLRRSPAELERAGQDDGVAHSVVPVARTAEV